MAARETKPGGKKPDKIWTHAIMRAVQRPNGEILPKTAPKLEYLADQLVEKAMTQDVAAMKEIGDRLEGKPSQSVALGQDPGLEPIQHVVRPALTREQWLAIYKR
jgi:hypothetical protein